RKVYAANYRVKLEDGQNVFSKRRRSNCTVSPIEWRYVRGKDATACSSSGRSLKGGSLWQKQYHVGSFYRRLRLLCSCVDSRHCCSRARSGAVSSIGEEGFSR